MSSIFHPRREDSLTPEEAKANTEVVDITDDPGWLAAVRWEVAVGYSKLANPERKLRMRDIYTAICEDGYEGDERSHTIAAMTCDAARGTREISGAVRLVLGRPQRNPSDVLAIDAMSFVTPVSGWPHHHRGKTDAQIAELGRFVITERYRSPEMRKGDVDAFITGTLVREATRIANSHGATVIYGLMPQRVAEINRRAGVGLEEVPINLKTDDPHASAVFDAFSLYWRRSPPRLFVMWESRRSMAELFAGALPYDAIIGDAAVIASRYGRNVTALERRIALALRPTDEEQVSRIVTIANEHRVALYPFSTGKNWGLGSKLPVSDNCVLLDLSRMNRIVEVSDEFGYAILEPGVTQIQLARYLAEHHPGLSMNFTGSFAHTGIVGNVLDRGDGAHARVDDLLGARGIFGNGRPFTLGGAWDEVGTGRPSHVQRYTAGPDLVGLVGQSNLGIVTQLAFKLEHKPELRCVVWGHVPDERLALLVDAIDRFGRQGAINRGSVNIGYANRFVQARETLNPNAPPTPQRDDWSFYILVGGTVGATEILAGEISKVLAGIVDHEFDVGVFRIRRDAGDHDPVEQLPAFLRPLIGPLLGMPDTESIKSIYELTGTPLPSESAEIDADQTPFGMKCYIAVVPSRGRYVRKAADIVAAIRRRTGLNLKASFFGDGRTLVTIHFRADDATQVARAEACETALWNEMVAEGFFPYRAAIDQMERLVELRPAFFELVKQLKSVLDPCGVISPGRYSP